MGSPDLSAGGGQAVPAQEAAATNNSPYTTFPAAWHPAMPPPFFLPYVPYPPVSYASHGQAPAGPPGWVPTYPTHPTLYAPNPRPPLPPLSLGFLGAPMPFFGTMPPLQPPPPRLARELPPSPPPHSTSSSRRVGMLQWLSCLSKTRGSHRRHHSSGSCRRPAPPTQAVS